MTKVRKSPAPTIGRFLALVLCAVFATGVGSGAKADPALGLAATAKNIAQAARGNAGLSKARAAALIKAATPSTAGQSTTYSSGVYTASVSGTAPAALVKGQTYCINFNQANPGAASLAFGALPAQSVKLLGSNGTALTLTGGEIVPGVQCLAYDGSEFILGVPAARVITVTSALTLTQANFAARDTILCTSACTLTLPLSTTLSANGGVNIVTAGVTATINTAGADVIAKNAALASATSTSVTQGAAVLTNASTGFFVSGT